MNRRGVYKETILSPEAGETRKEGYHILSFIFFICARFTIFLEIWAASGRTPPRRPFYDIRREKKGGGSNFLELGSLILIF